VEAYLILRRRCTIFSGVAGSLLLWAAVLSAQNPLLVQNPSPAGLWQTIDDKTHKARGLVRIFEKDGAMFGRIEASFNPREATGVCGKCDGDRKNKPVIGLLVMRDMKKRGSEYTGGDILDPDTGSLYKCKMSLEDDGRKLTVRGYMGIALLGRTQTWIRQK
jgi:uncharacterized protein (DUF2147 family)